MSATALVAVGLGYCVHRANRSDGVRLRARALPTPAPAPSPAPTATPEHAPNPAVDDPGFSGLVIDDDGMRVNDWGKWITFAKKALRQAIALGNFQPEPILNHMLASAFPDRAWPPPPHSLLAVDYRGMLAVLSSQIEPDPVPETRPHLRVVS